MKGKTLSPDQAKQWIEAIPCKLVGTNNAGHVAHIKEGSYYFLRSDDNNNLHEFTQGKGSRRYLTRNAK